jgi:hypothetical protein
MHMALDYTAVSADGGIPPGCFFGGCQMPVANDRYMKCPRCGSLYNTSKFTDGEVFSCQKCKTRMQVPKTAVSVAKAAPGIKPAAPPRAANGVARAKKDDGFKASTPLMRKAARAGAQTEGPPSAARGRERGSARKDNSMLIIGAVIGGIVLIGIIVLVIVSKDKEKAQPVEKGKSGGFESDSSSTPKIPGPAGGGSGTPATGQGGPTGNGGTPGDPKNPQDKTEPGTGDTVKDPADAVKTPKQPKKKREWTVDNALAARIVRLGDAPSAEQAKFTEEMLASDPDAVVPALAEAMASSNDMVGAFAAKVLRKIMAKIMPNSTNPGDNVMGTQEERQAVVAKWREWWPYKWYEKAGEKPKGVADEALLAEVLPLVKAYATGEFKSQQSARRDLKAKGTKVIPALIDMLSDEDAKFAQACAELLEKLTKNADCGSFPTEGSREDYLAKWKHWWGDNFKSFVFPE